MPVARELGMNIFMTKTRAARALALIVAAVAISSGSQYADSQIPIDMSAKAPAPSPGLQDLRAIETAVREELQRQAPDSTAEITPPDPRLRLAACDRPLRAALPPNVTLGARVNMRVSCAGGNVIWSVTIPALIWSEVPVVVAQRSLPMGSAIGPNDINVEVRRLAGTARCCASQPDEVLGRLVKRTIQANQLVPLDALETSPAVKRGETVMVIASLPGVEIRASGVALGDAQPGESVRVRHSTSLKVIQARADTQGVVRVDR
jgi:flagella basal body P-ring formation protein FlgA